MKERPILFSGPMVRAILSDQKTVTRRVVKPQFVRAPVDVVDGVPSWDHPATYAGEVMMNTERGKPCPYGKPGDRLWVREAFSGASAYEIRGYALKDWGNKIWYWADGNPGSGEWTRPRPSIHMPRALSRILLEITDVRVERLQDISEEQARAEGITDGGCTNCGEHEPCGCDCPAPSAIDSLSYLWNSINGADAWDANPWVWVVEFKRIQPCA